MGQRKQKKELIDQVRKKMIERHVKYKGFKIISKQTRD